MGVGSVWGVGVYGVWGVGSVWDIGCRECVA